MNGSTYRLVRGALLAAIAVSSLLLLRPAWAQGFLESPQNNAFASGIGLVSGWKCTAGTLSFTVDSGAPTPVAYGTRRSDVQNAGACSGLNTGFGALINWNLFGDGAHTVILFDDGVEFARATIVVTTLGVQFITGVNGIYTLNDFPATGQQSLVVWEQASQNFRILKAGLYQLQSILSEARGECLESNQVDTVNFGLNGASYMAPCGNFTGQLWSIVPFGNGYVQLQSILSQGRTECLESNAVVAGAFLGGAAHMATCGPFTGQLWKFVSTGSGFYQLQSMGSEARSECLESNQVDTVNFGLDGASYMAACGSFTGQFWKFVPI